MTVSLATDHLGIVLELNGIVNANLIAFILPGACGAALLEGDTFYRGKRLASFLLCLFGLAVRGVPRFLAARVPFFFFFFFFHSTHPFSPSATPPPPLPSSPFQLFVFGIILVAVDES